MKNRDSKIVVHLIPYDGIGGVETAARSLMGFQCARLRISVKYLHPRPILGACETLKRTVRDLWGAFWNMRRERPDVLVVSLWRSYVFGIIYKIVHPRVKLVLFVHLPRDVHVVDFLATRIAALLASEVWFDSEMSKKGRLPRCMVRNSRVISYYRTLDGKQTDGIPRPRFVFWGRLHKQKGLDRAIRIFHQLKHDWSEARFDIIGPDGGELEHLKQLVQKYGLDDSVQFCGPMNSAAICDLASSGSFYLQTSLFEGMALSVIEAMSIGLVPVVTPVGEIGSYAEHMRNSVLVYEDDACQALVDSLLRDPSKYRELHLAAIDACKNRVGYRESFVDACHAICAQ